MSETVKHANINRLEIDRFDARRDSPFCLAQIAMHEAGSQEEAEKVGELLESRIERETATSVEMSCSIGGCTMKLTEGPAVGRKWSGECRTASFCLEERFDAVGEAPTVAEGKEIYRDIVSSLESRAGGGSFGSFCPRLDCGLTAGVSEDMIPGKAGNCVVGDLLNHPQLPFDTTD